MSIESMDETVCEKPSDQVESHLTLTLDMGDKTLVVPVGTMVIASQLKDYFFSVSFYGEVLEEDIDYSFLFDRYGYAEVVAAKHLLSSMGIVDGADPLRNTGSFLLADLFDLNRMVKEARAKL
jgi:hypothetical protein